MKQKLSLMILLMTTLLFADYKAKISPITLEIKQRMIKGHSWRRGCPVPLKDLRYLQLTYKDFNGRVKMGEIIVHKDVSSEVMGEIFAL